MKKFVVMMSVIAAFSAAVAESANWWYAGNKIYDGSGSKIFATGLTGYLFDSAQNSVSSIYESWCHGGDVSSLSIAGAEALLLDGAASSDNFAYGDRSTEVTPKYYDFYFVVVDADKMYISQTIHKQASIMQTDVYVGFGNQNDGSTTFSDSAPVTGGVQGKWNVAPEPTSGLLLVLGVGLMALKRRRA